MKNVEEPRIREAIQTISEYCNRVHCSACPYRVDEFNSCVLDESPYRWAKLLSEELTIG